MPPVSPALTKHNNLSIDHNGARYTIARENRRAALRRRVLGLAATVAGAFPQRLQPRFEVFDQRGISALVKALQLVGVVLQVVELLLPVFVLDVLVGLRPDGPEGGLVGAVAPVGSFLIFRLALFPGAPAVEERLQQD